MWSRRQRVQGLWLTNAFVSSGGIWNLPITSLPVDNFNDRALWCKPSGINYNIHGWFWCKYSATGWFWWISGLRAMAMWSSASFTKRNLSQQTTHSSMPRVEGCFNSGQKGHSLFYSEFVCSWQNVLLGWQSRPRRLFRPYGYLSHRGQDKWLFCRGYF